MRRWNRHLARLFLLPVAGLTVLSVARAQKPTPPPPLPPVPLHNYQNLLHDYQRAAEHPLSHDDAHALITRFSATHVVTLPSGGRVTLNNQAEYDALAPFVSASSRNAPPLSKEAKARIGLLVDLADPGDSPGHALNGDPNAAASAILSAAEFQDAVTPKGNNTLWDQIVNASRWLSEKIGRFLNWLFGRRSGGASPAIPGLAEAVKYILFFLLSIGALVGIYYLARYLVANVPVWLGKRQKRGVLSGLDLSADGLPDPLSTAREKAASGDYREAVRLVYIACLRRLSGVGLVVLQENHTNWEYQRALRSRSKPAYDALLPATRLFDIIWYGNRPATREAFELVLKAHDALPEAPPQPVAEKAPSKSTPATGRTDGRGVNPW